MMTDTTREAPNLAQEKLNVDGGLIYALRDGINYYEINVTMAAGSRDHGDRTALALDIASLIAANAEEAKPAPEPVAVTMGSEQHEKLMLAVWRVMCNEMGVIRSSAILAGKCVDAVLAAIPAAEAKPQQVLAWEPKFDATESHQQEQLAIQFSMEIAGKRGEKPSPPCPVRLLEMAEALYLAERNECALPAPVAAQIDRDAIIEMCAKVCDSAALHNLYGEGEGFKSPEDCADAIRAMKGAANAEKQEK